MPGGDVFDDRQTQPGAFPVLRLAFLDPVESLRQARQVRSFNPRALIADADATKTKNKKTDADATRSAREGDEVQKLREWRWRVILPPVRDVDARAAAEDLRATLTSTFDALTSRFRCILYTGSHTTASAW